jgi:hypothetical protein
VSLQHHLVSFLQVLTAHLPVAATYFAAGSVGSGVAADIFAPFERGTALGISSVPPLVGPVM